MGKKRNFLVRSLTFLWGLCLIPGCFSDPETDPALPPVSDFDLTRYMGKWYEIARTPNPFEKGMHSVTALYMLKSNGRVEVLNQGICNGKVKTIRGFAKKGSDPEKGDLYVSFFRPFYSLYRIVLLGKEYQYSVVISSGGKYLWVLSRTRTLPEKDRAEILSFLKEKDLPVHALIREGL